MKQKIKSICCAIFCILPFSACASDNASENEESQTEASGGKTLVVYFSCTNTTKGISDNITKILTADEFCIEPTEPYTSADLNYNDDNCRANQEQNNDAARPAISKSIESIADYDIVYVGFPIWWGKLPKIMYTFFESYDLKGKTIIPFCTSGSSGISTAMNEIRSLEPNATVKEGKRFDGGANESTVKSWTDVIQPNIYKR